MRNTVSNRESMTTRPHGYGHTAKRIGPIISAVIVGAWIYSQPIVTSKNLVATWYRPSGAWTWSIDRASVYAWRGYQIEPPSSAYWYFQTVPRASSAEARRWVWGAQLPTYWSQSPYIWSRLPPIQFVLPLWLPFA